MSNVAATRAVQPPTPALYQRLHAAGAGPSEWYLFFYLKGLSQMTGESTVRTSLTALRGGSTVYEAIRMAPNTIRSALDNLEAAGLISISRQAAGVGVYLDVTFT